MCRTTATTTGILHNVLLLHIQKPQFRHHERCLYSAIVKPFNYSIASKIAAKELPNEDFCSDFVPDFDFSRCNSCRYAKTFIKTNHHLIVWFLCLIGLRCYNCISFPSKRDVGCETGNTTLMLTVECPATHKYCSTFRSIVSANNISESGPAYVRNCEEKRSTTGLAVYCRQDLCNAGITFLFKWPSWNCVRTYCLYDWY